MQAKLPIQQLTGLRLLPPHPSKCQECATEHLPEMPHNAQSLFYSVMFYMQHGRSPDWRDAMAHCTEPLRKIWTALLVEKGVDVAGGGVHPNKTKDR